VNLPGYCSCSAPIRAVHEGVAMCEACGEPIADRLLLRLLAEVLALRHELAELGRKLDEPPIPECRLTGVPGCEPRAVVPLWYPMHRPICPDRPRSWTHRKRRTLRDT
jgi:hypothetical protein